MPVRHEPWPAGTPCWIDLAAADVTAARAFYSAVLGWEFTESGPEFGGYLMAAMEGEWVGGIGATMSPEQPTAWTVYLATSDVDTTAKAVTAAGGQVVAGPFDVGPPGRMAVALDPTGAAFGLWQPRNHIGISRYNEPGSLTWEEAWVGDLERAKTFYADVFGYSYSPIPEMGGYELFATDGAELGAIGATDGPPHWAAYFSVVDTDAALGRAVEQGATVVHPAMDSPYGRMAELVDPQGAGFKLSSAPA
jgi:predicted enzyme related to lactoylglutathione lyase